MSAQKVAPRASVLSKPAVEEALGGRRGPPLKKGKIENPSTYGKSSQLQGSCEERPRQRSRRRKKKAEEETEKTQSPTKCQVPIMYYISSISILSICY